MAPGLSRRIRRLSLVLIEFTGPVPILVEPSFRLALRFPEQVGPFPDSHLLSAGHICVKLPGWVVEGDGTRVQAQNDLPEPSVMKQALNVMAMLFGLRHIENG
jgi:hypothetical protein